MSTRAGEDPEVHVLARCVEGDGTPEEFARLVARGWLRPASTRDGWTATREGVAVMMALLETSAAGMVREAIRDLPPVRSVRR